MQYIIAILLACASLQASENWILDYVHPVADFPQPGIQFQWYAHLMREPQAFRRVVKAFADRYQDMDIDVIVGLDSRGFIFGSALAYELEKPFVIVRKPGKLPGAVERIDYALEYGSNTFEIEKDSISPGQKVLVIDDLLATGGTAAAACELVHRLEGTVVEVACMIDLSFLNGKTRLPCPFFSLVTIN